MYYSPISISGMLILLIVLFFRKNEYTRGLFWALCMIVYGMIVKKFVGPILGWARHNPSIHGMSDAHDAGYKVCKEPDPTRNHNPAH